MHGIQYIVMVYFYNRHKVERTGGDSALMRYVAGKGGVKFFLLLCAAYAVVFHALSEGLVRDFGFGLVGFNTNFDLFSYSAAQFLCPDSLLLRRVYMESAEKGRAGGAVVAVDIHLGADVTRICAEPDTV